MATRTHATMPTAGADSTDLAVLRTFSREVRELVTDLHDDPLDEDLACRLVALLVHDAPPARTARDRLHNTDPQSHQHAPAVTVISAPVEQR